LSGKYVAETDKENNNAENNKENIFLFKKTFM